MKPLMLLDDNVPVMFEGNRSLFVDEFEEVTFSYNASQSFLVDN